MGRVSTSLLLLAAGCGRVDFDARPPDALDGVAGLVVRYPMDNDPQSGQVPADPATLSATCAPCPTTTPGMVAGGYDFAGDVRIVLPSTTLIGAAPFTVALWANAGSDGLLYSLVNKPESAMSAFDVFSLTVRGDTGDVAFESSTGAFGEPTPVDIRGAWHHLAASWDGTTRALYIDGALAATSPGTFADNTFAIGVGADLDNGAPKIFFSGGLDDLRFYDRALAADEVATIAHAAD